MKPMWVSRPIYESLPYLYMLAGALSLGASMYLNYWYWPTIGLVSGVFCLILGLFVMLRRREFRTGSRRNKLPQAVRLLPWQRW